MIDGSRGLTSNVSVSIENKDTTWGLLACRYSQATTFAWLIFTIIRIIIQLIRSLSLSQNLRSVMTPEPFMKFLTLASNTMAERYGELKQPRLKSEPAPIRSLGE